MTAHPRLEMAGVSRRFGSTVALDRVSLSVQPGEVHALVGENGAGKSTLMRILSGAERPDAGELRIDGVPYRPRHPLDARRAGVAMIYQELALAPHCTIEANILFGLEPSRFGLVNRAESRRRAARALADLGHSDLPLSARVADVPPAVRQVVEIARSLVTGCRILILDEPTSSLARADVARLFALIGRLKAQGIAIVYISHFLEEVQAVADRYTVLRDGVVAGSGNVRGTSFAGIIRAMVGREVGALYPRSPRQPGETVLEVRGLSGRLKPQGASLAVRRGEVVGLAGLVGAGRTEFLRALFGLDPVRSGAIRVGCFEGAAAPRQRWGQGTGYLSEDRKSEGLAVGLSVADNMTLTRLEALGRWGWVSPRRQRSAAAGWAERLGIRCRDAGQRVFELSGGNQQKVALARLLYHDVDVLLLDEPTRGIDVASKAQVYALIDELVRHEPAGAPRKAVLLASSYLPELLGVCDRIAVMCRGRLGEARPAGEWSEHELMVAATGVEGAR